MYTLQLPPGSLADTGELMIVGPPLGSDAVGTGLPSGVGAGSSSGDGVAANDGPMLAIGEGLLAVTIGTALTRTFMATKTPAMPRPITANTGARSRPRSKADFLRTRILRVCGTHASAAFLPELAHGGLGPADTERADKPRNP